jgi:hypothetical protein
MGSELDLEMEDDGRRLLSVLQKTQADQIGNVN